MQLWFLDHLFATSDAVHYPPHSGLLFVASIQTNIDLFGLKGTNAVDHQVDVQFDLWPRGRSSRQPSENRGYISELMKNKKTDWL